MKTANPMEIQAKVERIRQIKQVLENNKVLYEELDDLTLDLLDSGVQVNQTLAAGGGSFVTVVDNFAEKNTIYRAMPMKQFDVRLEDADELKKRVAKETKAKEKA